jgi:hypothetical protein
MCSRGKNLIYDKPGSGADIIMKSAVKEVMNLTKGDVIVFWGGDNNVCMNNSEIGLRHIITLAQVNGQTNIILSNVPHPYDMIKYHANKETTMFNRKLAKYIKICKYYTFLHLDHNRGLRMEN